MRNSCRIWVFSVLAAACLTAGGQVPPSAATGLRTLTTALEAHSLTVAEAGRGYPVHLRAVVTYFDAFIDDRHTAMFVHDASGSIFVRIPSRPQFALEPGTLVDLWGVSATGDYAPVVDHAQITVVGHSMVPAFAPRVTMAQLLTPVYDGQWVEVEGIVRAVRSSERNVTLDLATSGGTISATAVRDHFPYDTLVDALVRVHANEAPVFNNKEQLMGTHLYFPTFHEVQVVEAAPVDPYAAPSEAISQLLRYIPGVELGHRVHVVGRVTLQWPGRKLCIQQGSDGICMQTEQANELAPGDWVDVLGFPGISEYRATLENAIFRRAGGRQWGREPLQPVELAAADAIRGERDGELVQIEGELIGQDRAASDLTLMLHSGNFLFPVILPKGSVGPRQPSWREGSTLKLTGVCQMQVDAMTTKLGEGGLRPESVQILLRSMADVEVLETPSWWTPVHALIVIVSIVFVVLAAFGWIAVLRNRVAEQTRQIRGNEERLRHLSQHDSLTGLPNRSLLQDRLDMALKRTERFGAQLGLLMVDLDRFKEVNDSLGHFAGDRLLCAISDRLTACVRGTDTVARIGGDEFIVLLPDIHEANEPEIVAAKIVASLSQPIRIGEAEIQVSASVGVSTCPDGGEDASSLLQSVDAAMYLAKAQGRNGFQVFHRGAPSREEKPGPVAVKADIQRSISHVL